MKLIKRLSTRQLVMIGNFLEFFDLYLYVHLGFLIQQHLFPNFRESTVRIVSFCGLYFFAPIACLFWGYIGDTKGRRKVLVTSSFILSISTTLIAFIPDYSWWQDDSKIYSFIILMILRTLQGMAIGGEPFAAGLYAMENVRDEKYVPVELAKMNMSESAGGMLALGLAYISMNYLNFWECSWRIPFIVAGFSTLYVMYIRSYLNETDEYARVPSDTQLSYFSTHAAEIIKSFYFLKTNFFCNAILCMSYPVLFIFNYSFLSPLVVKTLGYPKEFLIAYNFCIVLGCFLFGYLAVRIPVELNWNKKITMGCYHVISAVCVIAFMMGIINRGWPIGWYIAIQVLMMTGIAWTLIAPSIVKAFPVTKRFTYTTMGASFSRITYFILFILIFPYVFDMNNVKLLGSICLIVIALAMVAVYLYVSYKDLSKAYILNT